MHAVYIDLNLPGNAAGMGSFYILIATVNSIKIYDCKIFQANRRYPHQLNLPLHYQCVLDEDGGVLLASKCLEAFQVCLLTTQYYTMVHVVCMYMTFVCYSIQCLQAVLLSFSTN